MPHIGLDATGADSINIPLSTETVGAYVTGSAGVPWTPEQRARFHNSGMELFNQDNSTDPRVGNAFDCEALAGTIAGAARWSVNKKEIGALPVIYIQESNLSILEAELANFGVDRYWIHLANWSLSRAEAEKRLNERIRAVQCQSPTSNPNTLVPGSHLTLAQANVDVSVCADDFFPAPHALPRPHGVANASLHVDLAHGDWHINPERGDVRLGVHGNGAWHVEPLPEEGDYWCAKVRIHRGH